MNEWVNWSGGVRARPASRVEIADESQLSALIRDTTAPIKVMGAGHSFSPLLETDGIHVSLTGLTGVAEEAGGIRAGAGIVLRDLTAQMHKLGHSLANMGDIDSQRLGGALATATHGTGADFTTYSATLREFTMMDGRGTRHVLSRAKDEAAFRALAVGLGTGGILTDALLTTIPPYRLARRRFSLPLPALIEDFDRLIRQARNTEFYYISHSDAVLGLESVATNGVLVARPPDRDQQGLRQLRLVGKVLGRAPRLRRWLLSRLLLSHASERFTEDWHCAYPAERNGLRFEESEWHVPAEAGGRVLAEIVATVERHFPDVYFPMEVRITAGDDLYLSPFFGREAVSIAVHHEAGRPFDPLLAAIEPIFRRADGRPHWGKRHSLTAADLRPIYPHWDEAIEARRHFDPGGRFLTPYLRRLLGL